MQSEAYLPTDQVLYLHFKVPGHLLKLEDFIATATSTATILYTLQKHGRYGIEDLEIYLEPPLPGSFLGKLIVVGKFTKDAVAEASKGLGKAAVGASVLLGGMGTYLDTSMGQGMLDEAKNITPEELGREIVRYVRPTTHEQVGQVEDEKLSIATICGTTTKFLAQSNEADFFNFYPIESFREAYLARNRFYATCDANPYIEAIGFDSSEAFPIQRAEFSSRIINLPSVDEVKTSSKKVVEIETLQIYSPDWSRSRRWIGMTNNKEVYLRIDDDNFWAMALANELPVSRIQSMEVQWVRHLHAGRQSNTVIKVLQFNGKKVSEPLDQAAIHALESDEFTDIEIHKDTAEYGTQMSFFD